jgi:hypothetical protein
MRGPGQELHRPPEGLAPVGSSGQAGRSRTSGRDDHPWRPFMGRGVVSLVAQDLTGRMTIPGEPLREVR